MKKKLLNLTGYIQKGQKLCSTEKCGAFNYKEIEFSLETSLLPFGINEQPVKVKITVEVLKEYPKIKYIDHSKDKNCKREWNQKMLG